jgi:mycothiol synthase
MSRRLPAGFSHRPATMGDMESMTQLFNSYWEQLIGVRKLTTEDTRQWLSTPGFDIGKSTLLVFSPDARLAGMIMVHDAASPPVHPNAMGCVRRDCEGQGIGAYLLAWAEKRSRLAIARVPDGVRVALQMSGCSTHEPTHHLLTKAGLQAIRSAYIMVIDLDQAPPEPQWPAGIVVRTFAPGASLPGAPQHNPDLRAVMRATREAFQDHWGHVDRDEAVVLPHWQHQVDNDPAFDPTLWFLAMDGEQIAAMALCVPRTGENRDMGFVDTLGVRRPWRRQGLALAMLHHVFAEFRRRGRKQVGLGVDAQSLTGATRLYEKAGMHVARVITTYEKELRPGQELGTQAVAGAQA